MFFFLSSSLSPFFLSDTSHDLAVKYNDQSVLENMHIATAIEIASDVGKIPTCWCFVCSLSVPKKLILMLQHEYASDAPSCLFFIQVATYLNISAKIQSKKFEVSGSL